MLSYHALKWCDIFLLGGVFMNTKRIAGMALMSALSIILVTLIHFPIFPATPFLEYDACDIPIMFATLIYGPSAGLIITIIVSIIQGVTVSVQSGPIGIIMHILATGSFVLTCGNLFKFFKKINFNQIASLAISTIVGSLAWLVVMVAFNLAITPLYMKVPFEQLIKLMLPYIIPFNLIKAIVNGTIGAILYIPLHKAVAIYLDEKPITKKAIYYEPPTVEEQLQKDDIEINKIELQEENKIIPTENCKTTK